MDHEISARFKAGAVGSIGQDRLTQEMDVERYISSMAGAIKNVPLSTDQAWNEAAKIFAAINAYAATASQEADNATELPAGESDEAVKLPSVGDVENAGGTGD